MKSTIVGALLGILVVALLVYAWSAFCLSHFSRVAYVGQLSRDSLTFISNPTGTGKFMYVNNCSARNIPALSGLLDLNGKTHDDVLLVFMGFLQDQGNAIHVESSRELNQFYAETGSEVVSVYSVSGKRLDMPPGVAVK